MRLPVPVISPSCLAFASLVPGVLRGALGHGFKPSKTRDEIMMMAKTDKSRGKTIGTRLWPHPVGGKRI